jgi:hypothetical protein
VSKDPLSGPLAAADDAAVLALGAIRGAVVAFPEAWPLVEIIYGVQCQPSKIVQAGETWIDLAGTLATATDRIDARNDQFTPSAWTGKDREAFDRHLSDYVGELYFDQATALTVGAVMVAVGVMIALLILVCFLVASLLAVLAVLFFASAASVVGEEFALSVEELALDVCGWAEPTLTEFVGAVETVSNSGGGIIDSVLALNAVGQLATGNVDVIKNLVQATIYTSLDALSGYASWREQKLTGDGMKNSNETIRDASANYGTASTVAGSETIDVLGPWATGDGWTTGGDAWKTT